MKHRLFGIITAAGIGCAGLASAQSAGVTFIDEGNLEAFVQAFDRSMDQYGCRGSIAVEVPDIHFDNDRASLRPGGDRQMDIIAATLSRFPHDHFVIEGHASAPGSDRYNMALSRDRAQTVLTAIQQRGIRDDMTSLRWFGERRLLYPNDPDHEYNRRVTVRRVDGNSAQIGAYTASDQGVHSIIARIMKRGERGIYAADPAVDVFDTGEPLYLCVSTSRSGRLFIEQREDTSEQFSVIGSWVLLAEGLVRHPASPEVFRFEGAAGREQIRLRHLDCDVASCGADADSRLESLRTDTGMRSQPIGSGSARDNPCNQRGVQCLTIDVRHE